MLARARACVRARGYTGACMRIRAYSPANPARNAYAPYCDVIYGPPVCTTFFDYLINGAIFEKK